METETERQDREWQADMATGRRVELRVSEECLIALQYFPEMDYVSFSFYTKGMPEFTMGDATPQYRITINFLTLEDVKEFSKRLKLNLGAKSDTAWFPQQKLDEPKEKGTNCRILRRGDGQLEGLAPGSVVFTDELLE